MDCDFGGFEGRLFDFDDLVEVDVEDGLSLLETITAGGGGGRWSLGGVAET